MSSGLIELVEEFSAANSEESYRFSEHRRAESDTAMEIIDDVILGFCFEIHRAIKLGLYMLDCDNEEALGQFEVVDCEGLDVFGQVPLKKSVECVCPNCQRNMAASRFAPHLEKCMGMGRNSSRIASRRLANSGTQDDDDDSFFDDDWTWNPDRKGKKNKKEKGNSPRRAKVARRNGEAGTPRPGTPSSIASGEFPATKSGPTLTAFEALSMTEKKALLRQSCGVISEHTGKMCTRSHRCPQHTDEQRRSVRVLLIGQQDIELPVSSRYRPDGSTLEPDDLIDVDSYEDGDGQMLRDTLNRLSWEEESNVSTGDDNSPAVFSSATGTSRKKRKKKSKHKRK